MGAGFIRITLNDEYLFIAVLIRHNLTSLMVLPTACLRLSLNSKFEQIIS
jgi:hypothetical protein